MNPRGPALAERKQLLLAQSELARLQLRRAGRDARALAAPLARLARLARLAPGARRGTGVPLRPLALALTAAALPVLGPRRLGRLLRIAGTGLALLRLARQFRR